MVATQILGGPALDWTSGRFINSQLRLKRNIRKAKPSTSKDLMGEFKQRSAAAEAGVLIAT